MPVIGRAALFKNKGRRASAGYHGSGSRHSKAEAAQLGSDFDGVWLGR
jgi:hypothetical protein